MNTYCSVKFTLRSDGVALLLSASHQKSMQQVGKKRILPLTRKFSIGLVIQIKIQYGKKSWHPIKSLLAHPFENRYSR